MEKIKQTVKAVDESAEIYLFGSVAENNHIVASDIDILVATNTDHAVMRTALLKAGVKPPFEIHIHTHEEAKQYIAKIKAKKL